MYIQNKNLVVPDGYKKMVLKLDAGTVGTDSHEAWLIPIDATIDELDDFAWQAARQHAESYGMYNKGDYWDMSDEELESEGIDLDADCYTEDIYGELVEYNAKEHDNHLIFGANNDFQWNTY